MTTRRTNTPFAIRTKEPPHTRTFRKSVLTKSPNDYSSSSPKALPGSKQAPIQKNIHPTHAAVITVSLPNNREDSIRHSVSFISKPPPGGNEIGGTYYCDKESSTGSDVIVSKPRSTNRKKRLISMQKTAAEWDRKTSCNNAGSDCLHDSSFLSVYGGDASSILKKGRANIHNKINPEKQKVQATINMLPSITQKEKNRFVPDPTAAADKKDDYIRYIVSKKSKQATGDSLGSGRLSQTKMRGSEACRKSEGIAVLGSARRLSKDNATNDNTHSFNLGGIAFEVHTKSETSPNDSFEHMKTQVSKEMNLMFYDFNGAGKRMMANESSQVKECNNSNITTPTIASTTTIPPSKKKSHAESVLRMVYQNKSAEKFFQKNAKAVRNSKKMKSTSSTHDVTVTVTSVKHSKLEEDEEENTEIQFSSSRSEASSMVASTKPGGGGSINLDSMHMKPDSSKHSSNAKVPSALAKLSNNSISLSNTK